MTTPDPLAIGPELRAIRHQHRLSLTGVEAKSGGRFKAVVIGSWERGDRHPPVESLRELLAVYGDYRLAVLHPGDVVLGGVEVKQTIPADVEGWAIEGRGK